MKLLDKNIVLNLALAVMVIGGLVFTLGFGICLYLARQEVTKEADMKIERDIAFVQSYMDGQLQRVEDVAYTLLSTKFGGSKRNVDGDGFVAIDPRTFELPSEEEVFRLLEQFLDANPQICGAAIGFEPAVYPNTKGEYGFAAYVTNVSGKMERLRLGEMHDYRKKEWYLEAAKSNKSYWSRPFRETSMNKVVTCYSLPLHGYGDRLVGVLACDINTADFRKKCNEIAPYPHAEVTVVDREFRFVCHSDTSFLLKKVNEVGEYGSYKTDDSMRVKMENMQGGNYLVNEGTHSEAFFHFCPIKRAGWTVSIECPSSEVYSGVERMKRDTTLIAIGSILIMLVCFIWQFRHLQKITISKASIENELKVASNIQMGMVPKIYPAFPECNQLDVYGFLKPAKSVGGDLYDYFIRDNRLFFCIGDVSGKGIPASLFMTVIIALLRNVSQSLDNPADILKSINDTVSKGNEYCMFCTMFVGVLDLNTGRLDYCNGGHNNPFIRRVAADGSVDVEMMDTHANISVGMMEGMDFIGEETYLKQGEAIFLYTDGVTEAEDENHNLFGDENTHKSLAEARKGGARSVKEFIDSVYQSVAKHAGNAEQSDDITMLMVEYK
ncbi:MAG: SpoIIE family protein phosphatase [Prevotellaceae bacterium]|nr:SpoIIE family protein phosphatase [Candidatus Minthosoma caballi]